MSSILSTFLVFLMIFHIMYPKSEAFLSPHFHRTKHSFLLHHPSRILQHTSTLHSSSENMVNDLTTSTTFTLPENEIYSSPFGGYLRKIRMPGEFTDDNGNNNDTTTKDNDTSNSFVAKMSVPTFAACSKSIYSNDHQESSTSTSTPKPPQSSSSTSPYTTTKPTRKGLEGIIPGAFLVENALSTGICEEMIQTCEEHMYFASFNAGKNNHGALQIVVSEQVAQSILQIIGPHIDLSSVLRNKNDDDTEEERIVATGLNRRWRIYKYHPDTQERFAPHIDAAFPGSGLSSDETTLVWDDYNNDDDDENDETQIMSRLTVLIYLNEDFLGGHTNFYTPLSEIPSNQHDNPPVVASIKPKAGSILLFPQGIGEDEVEYARQHWPTHEGTPVYSNTSSSSSSSSSSRPKYVIRSDVLFGPSEQKQNSFKVDPKDPLFQYDSNVRATFLPTSPIYNPLFLSQTQPLYNPHMGVENLGSLLYSLVRFTKVQSIVEIGAGYTTLWILQALKDNDDELQRIQRLREEGKCKLLDYPWTAPKYMNAYAQASSTSSSSSSLLCVDNCLHQRETATGAMGVARSLGLDSYLQFMQGDAFELDLEPESMDMVWCDFGVGSKMKEFIQGGAWKSLRTGGFLVCHSSLTNQSTRDWLEAMRALRGVQNMENSSSEQEDLTGLPLGEEFVEISLLEPHKHYQNSISIFQRRGKGFEEPLYSQYA